MMYACAGCGDGVLTPDVWGYTICRGCAQEARDLIDELIGEVRAIEILQLALAAFLLDHLDDEEANG
jgi:hypothetical protein